MEENTQVSHGWNAIDNALNKIYPEEKLEHFAPKIPMHLGGNDPLDGVSVYYDKENKFYHYITYGLTDLHLKESEDEEYSGWGFELTFKLKVEIEKETCPKWPIQLLQAIARVTFSKGILFDEFQTLPFAPTVEEESTIQGLLFVLDNQLGERNSEFGKFNFLQIFGLTNAEFNGIKDKTLDRRELINKELESNPLLITELNRK